ncbi:MAG: hypothetical protein U9R55_12640 [Pseudomonadota bacterium]|jgi:hypothetical protein|nr:hypothetical protein [Pseudomonadota bacterium]
MQSFYPERFERDMACTETEWLQWLPRAVGPHACQVSGTSAQVAIGEGELRLTWQVMPPRVIALLRLPRLRLDFAFSRLDDAQRHAFMKRFDLYTQRGGG